MWNPLIRLIIKLGLRDKQNFLRLLAEIEFGVAIFCFKLQEQARKQFLHNLATMLEAHGNEENKHGKMLAACADGVERITRTETGHWLSIIRPNGENIAKPSKSNPSSGKAIAWDSIKFPGERLLGVFKNFDGISKRYLSARIFFGNQSASDYPMCDKLAFMYILEEETTKFYRQMSEVEDERLKAIALQITGDEFNHANYLKLALANFDPMPEAAIDKWRDRLWWAKWGLVVDLIKFLWK
jgi:hypothetical protein